MSHGGNIRALREAAGGMEITDFSAGINPAGAPVWLRREIARTLVQTEHYPDIDCAALLKAAGREFSCPHEIIIPCNGTSEVLFALPRLAECKRALIPAPAYVDYRESCRRVGVVVEEITLRAENGFAYPSAPELIARMTAERAGGEGTMLYLCSPLNPAGSAVDADYIRAVALGTPQAIIIADAAYWDFSHDPRLSAFGRGWVGGMPENVVVLWSLTKFYAMPGLRLGLAFARGDLNRRIREFLPPWNVNTLSQAVGARALADREYYDNSRRLMRRLYAEFFAALGSVKGLTPYPSAANFLLCHIDAEITATELAARLIKRGLAVRVCTDFAGLGAQWLRLAVRTDAENARLIAALRECLPGTKCEAGDQRTQEDGAPLFDESPRPPPPANPRQRPTPALMLCGTSSNAGKSVLTAALCRIMLQDGIDVAPFKAQNMALNSYVTVNGEEMGRAQVVQAQAARLEPDVRMNPLLLKPNSDTGSQVILLGRPVGNMRVREYVAFKKTAQETVCRAYDALAAEHQAIILEGAGSPGEVNLKKHDLVNLRMAQYAGAPTLLVGDIDRGGVYAAFIGVYETFETWERNLVKGFIVNRFRGDQSLLREAHDYVEDFTGRGIFGVVPYIKDLGLPQEDSVSFAESFRAGDKWAQTLDVALLALPHISNFTDFDALAAEPDISLRLVRGGDELGAPDLIVIPGSKNVPGDLRFLRESGLAARVATHAANGGAIAGICGGLQILGRSIGDPHSLEGGGDWAGLGLLDLSTILEEEKTLRRSEGHDIITGAEVRGYEIHHGRSNFGSAPLRLRRSDGETLGVGDARIWGTYLHGVFDSDVFRRAFIDDLRARKGMERIGRVVCAYDLEPAFDRLATIVRAALDMPAIYRLMGL